jgi:hypothetical protein
MNRSLELKIPPLAFGLAFAGYAARVRRRI